MMDKFKSRKLWVTVIGGAITVFAESLGLETEAANQIVQLVSAYILGQGAVDVAGVIKSKN